MELEATGELVYWRGPAPYHFVAVPPDGVERLREVAASVTYGWGVLPVTAQVGQTRWQTSLFPKDGGYLVPIKVAVRRAENLEFGDVTTVRLYIDYDD